MSSPPNAGTGASVRVDLKVLKKRQKPDPLQPPPGPEAFPPYYPKDYFHFEVIHQSTKSRARVGRIHTPHGIIDTPGFVPVGTNGALKCVTLEQGDSLGMQLMFCNTYHLLVHPGPQLIAEAGGLHSFIGRNRPIITDSGGFQVFSFQHGTVADELNMKSRQKKVWQENRKTAPPKVSEEGVTFQSYRDGRYIKLTPESSVQAQKAYGSDIIIPLDELPPYHIDKEALRRSVYLSHRWMARSLKEHLVDVKKQAMYAVIHGGVDEELRSLSARYLSSLPFDGWAIGGSLGKDRAELMQLLKFLTPQLPASKPTHLLGIADVLSIEEAVQYGIDTFDSCFPTRVARSGCLFTDANPERRVNLKNAKFERTFAGTSANAELLLDMDALYAPAPKGTFKDRPAVTLAYLRHLLRVNEPVALSLLSLHNLNYMFRKMERIRNLILTNQI